MVQNQILHLLAIVIQISFQNTGLSCLSATNELIFIKTHQDSIKYYCKLCEFCK